MTVSSETADPNPKRNKIITMTSFRLLNTGIGNRRLKASKLGGFHAVKHHHQQNAQKKS